MNTKEGLFYTSEHEWIDRETGKLGITDFAQSQLGDVVYLDFAVAVGETVEANAVLGTVESVKTVSDIYVPFGGKIVAVNEKILDQPESVNQDPYGEGWMFQIEFDDSAEWDSIMDAKGYLKLIGVEK